jgi:hypothetical protein
MIMNLEYEWHFDRGGRGLLEVRFKKAWLKRMSRASKKSIMVFEPCYYWIQMWGAFSKSVLLGVEKLYFLGPVVN